MKVLTFLFFTFVVIWLIGLIFRATVTRWLKKHTEEYNRAFDQSQREAKKQARGSKEGDVVIESIQTTVQKKIRRDVGDYVEFEEVADTAKETKVE